MSEFPEDDYWKRRALEAEKDRDRISKAAAKMFGEGTVDAFAKVKDQLDIAVEALRDVEMAPRILSDRNLAGQMQAIARYSLERIKK
jgi:hypothetical protein